MSLAGHQIVLERTQRFTWKIKVVLSPRGKGKVDFNTGIEMWNWVISLRESPRRVYLGQFP